MTLTGYKKFCQQKFLFSEILSFTFLTIYRYWQKNSKNIPMVHGLTSDCPGKKLKK